ncbi:MAG: hypothetical protein ABI843_12660 [Dokdonella sp.]
MLRSVEAGVVLDTGQPRSSSRLNRNQRNPRRSRVASQFVAVQGRAVTLIRRAKRDYPWRRRCVGFRIMTKVQERHANERRRQEAARIIAANEKCKRMKQTDELLLDQDALERAAIRAGLERSPQSS